MRTNELELFQLIYTARDNPELQQNEQFQNRLNDLISQLRNEIIQGWNIEEKDEAFDFGMTLQYTNVQTKQKGVLKVKSEKSKEPSLAKSDLSKQPDDTLFHIFSFLNTSDLVSCSKVCKVFKRVTDADILLGIPKRLITDNEHQTLPDYLLRDEDYLCSYAKLNSKSYSNLPLEAKLTVVHTVIKKDLEMEVEDYTHKEWKMNIELMRKVANDKELSQFFRLDQRSDSKDFIFDSDRYNNEIKPKLIELYADIIIKNNPEKSKEYITSLLTDPITHTDEEGIEIPLAMHYVNVIIEWALKQQLNSNYTCESPGKIAQCMLKHGGLADYKDSRRAYMLTMLYHLRFREMEMSEIE